MKPSRSTYPKLCLIQVYIWDETWEEWPSWAARSPMFGSSWVSCVGCRKPAFQRWVCIHSYVSVMFVMTWRQHIETVFVPSLTSCQTGQLHWVWGHLHLKLYTVLLPQNIYLSYSYVNTYKTCNEVISAYREATLAASSMKQRKY